MNILTIFCIVYFSTGFAQDDSGDSIQIGNAPDGNRPGPPRPPGPPGPDDRCPKFNDWKNVTCWWPDTKFSDLPSECTYIYLPKKVPTAIQQLIRDKAEEAYSAIVFEYNQRGKPAKCGHCARSFRCRSRNLTEDSERRGPSCRPKEVEPVHDDCDDPAPCEISKDRGLCSEPFFLNPTKIGRINDLIKQKDHQGVADELFSVLPSAGKRSKRQSGFYNNDNVGFDRDYGMNPQFDEGDFNEDDFGFQRDPGYGQNGDRRGGQGGRRGPGGNDGGFGRGNDYDGFGPQQDDSYGQQRPPTPFGRGGDNKGRLDSSNFGPFPGPGRRGGQGGRGFGPRPDGDDDSYGPGRGGRQRPGGLGPVPEDDGSDGENFGPGRRGGQGGRGFGPRPGSDGDDQGFGPRRGGRPGPSGDGSDGGRDQFGPRQDDSSDQQRPPQPFGPFPGRRGFGPGGRGGRRGPPPFGPGGDDDSDFGPGGRGGRRGPPPFGPGGDEDSNFGPGGRGPPPFGPGGDDDSDFGPGGRGGRRGPPPFGPFGPGPRGFGPRGRGGRRPPFFPLPFVSGNNFGSNFMGGFGQSGTDMMPIRLSLMTMPQMSLWTGNQQSTQSSRPLDHHEEARGFIQKLLHGTTCISTGDKCLCCCGPFIPNAVNKTCDDARKLFPGIEGVATNLTIGNSGPGDQDSNPPSMAIEMPTDNDENQSPQSQRSMPIKMMKPDIDF